MYRGFKGRLRAKARKRVFESDLGREAAAMAIERIFRGHKASGKGNNNDIYTQIMQRPGPQHLLFRQVSPTTIDHSDSPKQTWGWAADVALVFVVSHCPRFVLFATATCFGFARLWRPGRSACNTLEHARRYGNLLFTAS